ncbi:MAG: DUF1254 domain-containing protein [Cyanobacteriota bacterium]|nr:DUF1254 domain-containing protein [Cyanobacteriota bacterium]
MGGNSAESSLLFFDDQGQLNSTAVADAIVASLVLSRGLAASDLQQLIAIAKAFVDAAISNYAESGLSPRLRQELVMATLSDVLSEAEVLPASQGMEASERIDLALSGIVELAYDAYIYGFAPVSVDKKSFDQTNSTPDEAVYAPINQLYIDTQTATPDSSLFVSPNVNVVYGSAHLDLSREPIVLQVPLIEDRYYSWQVLDAYTNSFAYLGTRATNGEQGVYAIVGPDYKGFLPSYINPIVSPTNSAWLLGRIELEPNSQADLDQVIQLMQESILLSLGEYEDKIVLGSAPDYLNPIIVKPPADVAPLSINGLDFYTQLNSWLLQNPPPASDAPILAELMQIGISSMPDSQVNFQLLPQAQQAAILLGERLAELDLRLRSFTAGSLKNGWLYNLGENFGNWGDDYLLRSLTARGGLGANINQEAVYPVRLIDSRFQLLDAERDYRLTFQQDEFQFLSASNGFWSLTLYDRNDAQLASNAIDRYSLGSQDFNNLQFAEDGSLTFYIQPESPGASLESNWLPTPENGDPFYMLFRSYLPAPEFYTPSSEPAYILPQVHRLNRVSTEDGRGGSRVFKVYGGDDINILGFGGFGAESRPSEAIVLEVDTVELLGDGLLAKNMQLKQNGRDLLITFVGDSDGTLISLRNFKLQNLGNSRSESGLGNLVFDDETSVSASFDVFDSDSTQGRLRRRDSVTFLNELDNRVKGFKNSDDVINGQDGDDHLKGRGGDDILRGDSGRDWLTGGKGNDSLAGGEGMDWLKGGRGADVFLIAPHEGADTIADFSPGTDKIELAGGLTYDELTFSGAEIYWKSKLLATLIGIDVFNLGPSDFIV